MVRDWSDKLSALCLKHDHPAWGFGHANRVFRLSNDLAREAGDEVDWMAMRAASLIHDLGAVAPFRREGVDHAQVAVELAPQWLAEADFPVEKHGLVQTVIAGHMFYAQPEPIAEAVHFHDADVLDFLGCIGLTRLLAVQGTSPLAPDLPGAVERIDQFAKELPEKLITGQAKKMARIRVAEMEAYLEGLSSQTGAFHVI